MGKKYIKPIASNVIVGDECEFLCVSYTNTTDLTDGGGSNKPDPTIHTLNDSTNIVANPAKNHTGFEEGKAATSWVDIDIEEW